jgi:hypothetical protein
MGRAVGAGLLQQFAHLRRRVGRVGRFGELIELLKNRFQLHEAVPAVAVF